MAAELASRLEPIVAEAVAATGFDLDALDVQQAGRRKLVKVVVDSDDGVGLDEVAEISRAVSAALDQREDLIAGAYTLEVTSPGVDRPLTKPRHWRRAKYRRVRITPTQDAAGAEFVGRVGHAGEESVRVLVDEGKQGGQSAIRDVGYRTVAKAVIEIEFRQPPAEELKRLDEDAAELTDGRPAESKEEQR